MEAAPAKVHQVKVSQYDELIPYNRNLFLLFYKIRIQSQARCYQQMAQNIHKMFLVPHYQCLFFHFGLNFYTV